MSSTSEFGAATSSQPQQDPRRREPPRHDRGGDAQDDETRGHRATTPSDVPGRSWKDIPWRLYENFNSHRIMAVAAGVTFYALLALFPAIAALVSLYGLFADPGTISRHLGDLSSIVPSGATEIVGDEMNRVASNGNRALGLTFVVSLAVSLWSANAGMKALFDALNVVHGEREQRGFVKLNAISLLFTTCAIGFMLLAFATVVALPPVLGYVGLSAQTGTIIRIGRWPVLLVTVALAIAILYRVGPSRDKARRRWVSWGSTFSAVAWLAVSILFSWYTAHFGSYNTTYGSLGAVFGFMTWIWLSTTVMLIGAELDAAIEQRNGKDTGHPAPDPSGARL